MSAPHHHVIPPLVTQGRLAVTREELIRWGEAFGAAARAPLVVAISGDIGAGKTTLVQAVCRGAGVREAVTSPTYAHVHRNAGPDWPVYHLDLYRLDRADDLTNIGWDDLLDTYALVLVEWPERAGSRMPSTAVVVELQHDPDDPDRRLLLAG
jgi:tRNA threonylcarbamoyladenosine biosynthesis protein TsaE